MTLSGYKVGAPIGVEALVVARSAKPTSLLHGGGQERSLRSGTVKYSLAASFAAAAKEAIAELDHEAARLGALKDQMEALVMEAVPSAIITALGANRAAYNAHFIFPGTQSDGMLFLVGSKKRLRLRGVGMSGWCARSLTCFIGHGLQSIIGISMGSGNAW